MIKPFKKILVLLVFLFLLGFLGVSVLYHRSKKEIVWHSSLIVGSILEHHPELEREIIESLNNENYELGEKVLKKYGYDRIESLDYFQKIRDYRNSYFIYFLVFYFVMSFCFLVTFYFILKKQQDGIKKVDRYLFSLLSEEIQVDLKDFQSGELESLQNDLMKVTSRLKNALEHSNQASRELARTLADISHQLKTPLTSLVIINDALFTDRMDEDTRFAFLKKQEEVIQHMKTLVISLLKVSQIESGMIELKKETVLLKKLISEALEDLELLLVNKNICIETKISTSVFVVGDYLWLKEALLNILKNAVEHSFYNGKIFIQAKDTPIYTELLIKDFGCGIKKEDLPHIFERFYKSGLDKDSIGIGLNLSKSIMDRMNATIRVSSKVNEYTIFTIHFYKSVV